MAYTQEERGERGRRQSEYEEGMQNAIEQLTKLVAGDEWEEIQGRVEAIVESVQNMAFMEGYLYAISILEEGIVNWERRNRKEIWRGCFEIMRKYMSFMERARLKNTGNDSRLSRVASNIADDLLDMFQLLVCQSSYF